MRDIELGEKRPSPFPCFRSRNAASGPRCHAGAEDVKTSSKNTGKYAVCRCTILMWRWESETVEQRIRNRPGNRD